MPAIQGKIEQDLSSEGLALNLPSITTKHRQKRQKDKWSHFRAASLPPPSSQSYWISVLLSSNRGHQRPLLIRPLSGTIRGSKMALSMKWLKFQLLIFFKLPFLNQRRRDDNKNKVFASEGGGPWGQRGKSSKSACFRGKRHDNKNLKVQISLSRHFVVIAQAPNLYSEEVSELKWTDKNNIGLNEQFGHQRSSFRHQGSSGQGTEN